MAKANFPKEKSKREYFKRRSSRKLPLSSLTLEKLSKWIRERAYYLWEEEGRPQGKDLDIWVKAEREVFSQLIKK